MTNAVFLLYPCGKKIRVKVPIVVIDENGKAVSILPSDPNYFLHAKSKFQINNLKVIEMEIEEMKPQDPNFVSLYRKVRCV